MKARQKFEHAIWDLMALTGIYKPLRAWYGGMGTILCLHRVVEEKYRAQLDSNRELEITPSLLQDIINYFKRKDYEFVSLDEVVERLRSPRKSKAFVAFTFDDGYRDNYTLAYPILKKENIPLAVYVATDFPDQKAALWWYVLEEHLTRSSSLSFSHEGMEYTYPLNSIRDRNQAFTEIKRMILRNSSVLHSLGISVFDLNKYVVRLSLSWKEIMQMAQEPLITIAAHSVSHRPLSVLCDSEMRKELVESKEKLEGFIGCPVVHFSFPFGDADTTSNREFNAALEVGYSSATTTRAGNIFAEHGGHLACLPRISISGLDQNLGALDQAICGLSMVRAHRFDPVVTF